MNLVKKLLLPLTLIVIFAGCSSQAEKEKHDIKIFEEQMNNFSIEKEIISSLEAFNKYGNMDKKEAEKELNKEMKDMLDKKHKQIDKNFSEIKSKIGKEIVEIYKEIAVKEVEIEKESILRVINDDTSSGFFSLMDLPIVDELDKLYEKHDALLTELYNRVNQGDTAQ